LFDFCGRVFLIPIMLVVYLTLFTAFSQAVLALFIVVVGICAAIGLRETASVRTTFAEAVNVLHARSLDPQLADTLTRTERYALYFAGVWGFHYNPVDLSASKGVEMQHTYADKGEFGLSSPNPYYKERRDQPAATATSPASAPRQREGPSQPAPPTALPRQRSNLSHMTLLAAANAAASDTPGTAGRARAASPTSRPPPLSTARSAPVVAADVSPLRGRNGHVQESAPPSSTAATFLHTPSWQIDAATGAALPGNKRRNKN
jgi:hypothetical protein